MRMPAFILGVILLVAGGLIAAGFLYLEVLDASFSFDGVVGAFQDGGVGAEGPADGIGGIGFLGGEGEESALEGEAVGVLEGHDGVDDVPGGEVEIDDGGGVLGQGGGDADAGEADGVADVSQGVLPEGDAIFAYAVDDATPEASAPYSRERETASWMTSALCEKKMPSTPCRTSAMMISECNARPFSASTRSVAKIAKSLGKEVHIEIR